MNIQKPQIINDLLKEKDFENLKKIFSINKIKSFNFEQELSRYIIADNQMLEFKEYINFITPIAKEIFKSDTLMPTYSLFSHYEGPNANLYKHKDDNACTYTIDMCLYQKYAWDLWVENQPYTLLPNQALAYYGNNQEHWRESFPMKEINYVAMIFFHFAEPDHWWFVKGPGYLDVVRGNLSEEEWQLGQNQH